MKKTGLLMLLLVVLAAASAQAQKRKKQEWQVDEFSFITSYSLGLAPLKLSMLANVGSTSGTYTDGYRVTSGPEYAIKDSSRTMINTIAGMGLNIPLYRSENWSVGTKLGLGVGYAVNLNIDDDYNMLLAEFPQFVYYRNYKTKLDFTLLLGYKYTFTTLQYHNPLGAVEVNLKNMAFRFHASLLPYKYYRSFTDGRTETAVQYSEYAVTVMRYF